MKIDNIKLENFKSFKNQDLELGNVTLLTGINSTGKSSLIQGILLIKQNLYHKTLLTLFADDSLKESFRRINLKGKYLNLGVVRNILYENAETEKIKIGIKQKEKEVLFEMNTQGESDNDQVPCEVICEDRIRYTDILGGNFQYLKAERIGAKAFYEYSKSKIKSGDIGISGEYTAHYLAEKKNEEIEIEALKAPDSKTNQLLENASIWLSKISKGIYIKTEIIRELEKVKLLYTYEGGKKDYSPKDVGFGITYTLPIIVSILKSRPGDVIIIENPESHLHPSGQVEIARLCALAGEAGVQIIMETHSDHILNGLRVAIKEKKMSEKKLKVYYFEKDLEESKSEITEIEVNSNGKIEKWPKGFFDEFDIQLEKLLW